MSTITFYSLSDYNEGSLIPFTIDLSEVNDNEDYYNAINEALEEISERMDDGVLREEWIVCDFEGIPHSLVGEYDIYDTYWDYKDLIDNEDVGMINAAIALGIRYDNILDNYVGEFACNMDLFDELGSDIIADIEKTVPSCVCIDWNQTAFNFSQDFLSCGDYYFYNH